MKCFSARLPFKITLVIAVMANGFFAFAQQSPEDLPAPLTTKSVPEESLDALDMGAVKPLPYHGMEDDPLTPVSQSTISQFVTLIEDIEPYDILERPGIHVGWFADLELTAASVQNSNRMQSGSLLGVNPISVQSAPLDWTAMPKVTLGYRLPEGYGELSASYRFLLTQGDGSIPSSNGANASSRLLQQVLDLDYALSDLFPNDLWLVPRQIRVSGGVRVASINYKTSASGGSIEGQSAQNTFYGAGPRFGLESLYPIGSSQWTLFGKFDGAGVIGSDRQTFSQTTGGVTTTASSSLSTIATPVLGLRAGVHWFPDWGSGNFKLSAGYQWERWYNLGTDSSSFNELTIQGPFLRGEVAF
jgi:hypothetical protein